MRTWALEVGDRTLRTCLVCISRRRVSKEFSMYTKYCQKSVCVGGRQSTKGKQEIKVWDWAEMGWEGVDQRLGTRVEPNGDKTKAEAGRQFNLGHPCARHTVHGIFKTIIPCDLRNHSGVITIVPPLQIGTGATYTVYNGIWWTWNVKILTVISFQWWDVLDQALTWEMGWGTFGTLVTETESPW